MSYFLRTIRETDWFLFFSVAPLLVLGLLIMKSFGEGSDYFFPRQLIWILVSIFIFFVFSRIDWRIFKNSLLVFLIYLFGVLSLVLLLLWGGAGKIESWFRFYSFSIQPSEPMKIILILILAQYLSRRHIEISHFKHIIVSGIYALMPIFLVFFQPDLGSAIIFALIWFGLILSSEISKKHLLLLFLIFILIAGFGWSFLLAPYQKARIVSFLNPYFDPMGRNYQAHQSMIAVGSGGFWGKGIGQGGQTRLEFLPEYQTDFMFAALSEELGLIGVFFVLLLFTLIIWEILSLARMGESNFERFFALGFCFFLMGHIFIHIGSNIGLFPITGLPLPFLSYGGSHLVSLFMGLGIWQGMRRYSLQ